MVKVDSTPISRWWDRKLRRMRYVPAVTMVAFGLLSLLFSKILGVTIIILAFLPGWYAYKVNQSK